MLLPVSGLPKGLFQVSTARTQEDELDPLAHHPAVVLMDEVHALLIVQAPYEAQHGDVSTHWQPQLLHHPAVISKDSPLGANLLDTAFTGACSVQHPLSG